MAVLYQIQPTRVVEIWYNIGMDNELYILPPYLAHALAAWKKGDMERWGARCSSINIAEI